MKDRPHNVQGTVAREVDRCRDRPSIIARGGPRVAWEVDSSRGSGAMEVGCTVGTDMYWDIMYVRMCRSVVWTEDEVVEHSMVRHSTYYIESIH